MAQIQVEQLPDGSYRVRNADGDLLYESASAANVQAFAMGYAKGLGVAIQVMKVATADGIDYLTMLKTECTGVLWGEQRGKLPDIRAGYKS